MAAFLITIFDRYREMALDFNKQVGKTKAVVPESHHLSAFPCQGRIDKGYRIAHIDENDPCGGTDLRRCNSSTKAVARLEIFERVAQIAHEGFQIPAVERRYGFALLSKDRIPKQENFANSHRSTGVRDLGNRKPCEPCRAFDRGTVRRPP